MVQDIQTGDVGMVRRKITWNLLSWVSAAIRFFTGSRWNHTISFIQLPYGLYVIEAVTSGIRMYSWEHWVKKYPHDLLVIRFPDSREFTKEQIGERLISHLGKPYDYTALIKHQVIFQVARWFGIKKWTGRTDKTGASEKIYCSELVALAYDFNEWWTYTTADFQNIPHQIIYDSRQVG